MIKETDIKNTAIVDCNDTIKGKNLINRTTLTIPHAEEIK